MGDKSAISWTDASWNVVTGCSKVSPGCAHCYAETLSLRHRWSSLPWTPENAAENVVLHPDRLLVPLEWRKPRRIFTNSMSDLFHDQVPDEFIDRMFAVMAMASHHTFQILTKRAERMRVYLSAEETPQRIVRAMDAVMVDREMQFVPIMRADIEGYEGLYEISNRGDVFRNNRALTPREHGKGYRSVSLSKDGEVTDFLIQRLVLRAFVGEPEPGQEACHRNGDRSDNRVANLRWGTRAENMADASRHGTAGVWMKSKASLSVDEVAAVRSMRAAGHKLGVIASRFGITNQQVSAIALGKILRPPPLEWPLANAWIGVSAENQHWADERIPLLLDTPAAVRFVSAEPLLGPINLDAALGHCLDCDRYMLMHREGEEYHDDGPRLDWVIVGGESGPRHRPMDHAWAQRIRNDCRDAGVAYFGKQDAGPRAGIKLPGELGDQEFPHARE